MRYSALIVGGDHVDRYKDFLQKRGFSEVDHWDGRRNSECHRQLPQTLDLLVIIIDQVNHSLLYKIRRLADMRTLPVIYTPRSIARFAAALDNVSLQTRH